MWFGPTNLVLLCCLAGGLLAGTAFWWRRAQRVAEDALARERSLLYTLTESLPDYVYAKDLESRFLLLNSAGARMMGCESPRDVLGKTDFDFFPQELAARYYADEQALLKSGESLINQEEPCLDPVTGAAKWLLTTKVPFRDGSGRVIGLVGLGRDITENKAVAEQLRRAKEEAEAASKAKSEFLANMSHEIRTPMNGIIGMTELVMDTGITDEQRECLDTVQNSVFSLLAVLNDILDFSKIEAGKLDLEYYDFELRDSLEMAVKMFAVPAYRKGIELVCDFDPEVPQRVMGDPTRLKEIVTNLVGNAIKFTEHGVVVLEVGVEEVSGPADADGVLLRFTVRDTGIGIPAEKRESVFHAFSQADGSTTRRYGGTGLGLTISARLCEMMGGRLWVESEVGKGSQFHFTTQFGRAQEAPAPRAGVEDALVGIKVLVVDDNATNRRIFEQTLRRWGMQPEPMEGGSGALVRLQQAHEAGEPFGLVLTDSNMPDQDGFDLVERIRQAEGFGTVPVVMASSAGQRGDAERCRALGISAYLSKPVRQTDLRNAILRAVGRSAASATAPAPGTEPARPERRTRLRILVAEDNSVNQLLAVRLLEKAGHTVTVAGNGRETLEALERAPVDLVLMDVQMPEMDGLEAAAAIREKEKTTLEHVPIIALTAHAIKGDLEKCLAAGMDRYLCKPIRSEALYQAIEELILY